MQSDFQFKINLDIISKRIFADTRDTRDFGGLHLQRNHLADRL